MMQTLKIKVDNLKVVSTIFSEDDVADGWILVEDVPSDFFDDPFHWMYVDGSLVKDTATIEKEEKERLRLSSMWQYRQSLADSDYRILKFAESLLEVNSITDFLTLIIKTRQELRDIVRQRAEWRRQINELEAKTNGNS